MCIIIRSCFNNITCCTLHSKLIFFIEITRRPTIFAQMQHGETVHCVEHYNPTIQCAQILFLFSNVMNEQKYNTRHNFSFFLNGILAYYISLVRGKIVNFFFAQNWIKIPKSILKTI